MGCQGWTFPLFTRLIDQLRNTVQPVHSRHRNQLCKDWIKSCSEKLDIPVVHDFNKTIRQEGGLEEGVGFFSVSYNPDNGTRSSASVAYLHPWIRGDEKRPNLTVLTEAWVNKVNVEGDKVTGINLTTKSGANFKLKAKTEVILCAGAVDTPRLLLHSGIGPRGQLEDLGIEVVKDIPGVGENLLDHPESIIMWELNKPMPTETTMESDAGIFLRREIADKYNGDKRMADIMMHCYQIPFCLNTARLGYDAPLNAFCMTPNIPRPRSRGKLYLTSNNPADKPALDFRYFTDPEGYDAATIVAGLKAAREVAQQEPFKGWLKREVAPGPKVQTDEELSEYGRRVAHTVYHPAGTTKMGDTSKDEMAVVGPDLKMKGLKGIRIADAGVFPVMVSINPMLTVLAIGERCAELLAEDAGWKREDKPKL
jgi:choline dehydrogenase-like flavoprotein